MSDSEDKNPKDKHPKPYTCEICGRGAQELEPGNYLSRMSPLGIYNPTWNCRSCINNIVKP